MSAASDILAVLQATGGAVEVVCPACKALVDLGEAVAALALKPSSEAAQVATAEQAILDADASALAALKSAHVTVAPSPVVQAAGAVAGAGVAAWPQK
jgi:hypothetical protein